MSERPPVPMLDLEALSQDALRAAYAAPSSPWLRLNFVSTIDGAITGEDGLSKSINNAADHRVFDMLRELCDVLVVGAGTVRDEGYQPSAKNLVLVSRSGAVPRSLRAGDLGKVWMATGSSATYLAESQELLGERCLVLGEEGPDLPGLLEALHARGFADVLCEGGPSLARDLLAAGLVDELCLTVVPHLLAGVPRRLLHGDGVDVNLELAGMLHASATLLQRWFVVRD